MHSIWDILGLDGQPANLKDLKKAYAKKLRVTRPEDDPAGFMELRDAFEHAKQFLKTAPKDLFYGADDYRGFTNPSPISTKANFKSSDEDTDFESRETSELDEPPIIKEPLDEPQHNEAEPSELEKLLKDIRTILRDREKREFLSSWEEVFARANTLSFDDYDVFERDLIENLLELFGYYTNPDAPFSRELYAIPIRFITNQMGWDKGYFGSSNLIDRVTWLREYGKRPSREASAPKHSEESSFPIWAIIVVFLAVIRVFYYFGDSGSASDYTRFRNSPEYNETLSGINKHLEEINKVRRENGIPEIKSPSDLLNLELNEPNFEILEVDGNTTIRLIEPDPESKALEELGIMEKPQANPLDAIEKELEALEKLNPDE